MEWGFFVKTPHDTDPFGSGHRLVFSAGRLGSRRLRTNYRSNLCLVPRQKEAELGRSGGAIAGRPKSVCVVGSLGQQSRLRLLKTRWGTGLIPVAVFTHFKLRSARTTIFSGSGHDRNESLTFKNPI